MQPKKIALLTDSCADITPELVEKHHIFVVPLRILCADGEYLDEEIEGTFEDWSMPMKFKNLPGMS